jgi:hypothetical protein
MSYSTIKDVTKYSRSIDIENGPRLEAGYPRGEYLIEATRITVDWTSDEAPRLVHVQGPRVLKDGTLGKWRGVSYGLDEARPSSLWPAPPSWILDLIS